MRNKCIDGWAFVQTGGNADHVLDDVNASDLLRNSMLHLVHQWKDR